MLENENCNNICNYIYNKYKNKEKCYKKCLNRTIPSSFVKYICIEKVKIFNIFHYCHLL